MNLDDSVFAGKNLRSVYRENRAAVVNIVRRYGPISKPDIARMTGLTTVSATNIIRDLTRLGFIKERGTGKSASGRRATLYSLDGDGKYSICVDMSDREITVAAVDLAGRIVSSTSFLAKPGENTLVLDLIHSIDSFIKTKISAKDQVLGIGVALPGTIDLETGTVLVALPLGWHNVPLKLVLSQAFDYPVFVTVETEAAILGEYYFGEQADYRRLVYLNVGTGVGAGILIDNRIYRGAHGIAGEIGHTPLDPNGPECECGNRGCLERLASMRALIGYVEAMLDEGRESFLSSAERDEEGKIRVSAILQAARQGDEVAREAIQKVAGYLATGVMILARVLDPDVIFLGGNIVEKGQPLFEEVKKAVEDYRPLLGEKVIVKVSSLGESARLLGTSITVFKAAFERRLNQKPVAQR
ncbi:MAG: ROK family protein [Firmicutes bacterium]|nr:ROK family protein [Bacillota bacterium]